jgi:hypothetical protein
MYNKRKEFFMLKCILCNYETEKQAKLSKHTYFTHKLKFPEYLIKFKRKGDMQMPIDFAVIDKNDSAYLYHIPNTWFEKPVKTNVLPRWIGVGRTRQTFKSV